MNVEGEYELPATRALVWAALNDPEVLQRCIPGCTALRQVADNRFEAEIRTRIGPVQAAFRTDIELRDLVPEERYTLSGNARSPVAGFGKGEAQVSLADAGAGTRLGYVAQLQVGGKLAQVGSRLVLAATRKTADEFFAALRGEFVASTEKEDAAEAPAAPQDAPDRGTRKVSPPWHWWLLLAALLVATVVGYQQGVFG